MPKTQQTVEEVLPPAGDAQREELKRREDVLQEQAELLAAETDRYTMDPSAMEVDNEIAQLFDELEVTNRVPGRRYCWVQIGGNGRFIQQKRVNGWHVVQGNDVECEGLKREDTTRRVGDTLLMWIPEERWQLLQMRDQYRKQLQEEGVAGGLQEVADKYASVGARVHIAKGADARSVGRMAMSNMAQQSANRQMDQWLREGRMPGMPMPQ